MSEDLYERTLLLHRRQSQVPPECLVYLAKHRETGEKCVYKWLRDGNHARELEFLERLHCQRHTKEDDPSLSQGKHCGIIDVLDHFDVPDDDHGMGGHVLVFEHIEESKPTSSDDLKWYMYHLLRALSHCHRRGVIHRDVKPANVLYDNKTQCLRLIDFGSAEYIEQAPDSESRPVTRGYVAPELRGSAQNMPSAQSDVYAAGVIMAGHMFSRVNVARFPNIVVHEKVKEEDQPRSDAYSDEAFALLNMLLHPDPSQRISASDALLEPFLSSCHP